MARYLIFCNVSLTTWKKGQRNFVPEIVKLAGIKVTNKELEEVERFEKFCKPTKDSVPNNYCVVPNDMSQSEINNAKPFNEVWKEFEQWVGDIRDVSFIFWGKETIKNIYNDIKDKGYNGSFHIQKYFNFQSYLTSKTGNKTSKLLTMREALNMFNLQKVGMNRDAMFDAINLKNLYCEIITSSDINKLWFEGKSLNLIAYYNELYDYFFKFEASATFLPTFKEKTTNLKKLISTSSQYTSDERELLLLMQYNEMVAFEKIIESYILRRFREESMPVQWTIIKNRLPDNFSSTRALLDYWERISRKYKIFNMKRRGKYYMQFDQIKILYRAIGSHMRQFCIGQDINPVELKWIEFVQENMEN